MRIGKKRYITIWFVLSVFLVSVLWCYPNVHAATSGEVPCSEGSVSWSLSDSGELVFSGNGTTDILNGAPGGWWNYYWNDIGFVKSDVTSIRVAEGSAIQLDAADGMFLNYSNCTSIDMTGFDTTQVEDMSSMFYGCTRLENLNITNMDTSNVIDMCGMFSHCYALPALDVTSMDTNNVTDMSGMFCACYKLTDINLSKFKTHNVTDMSCMFQGAEGLKTLDLSSFDTSKVTDMFMMFSGCIALESLDVSNFNTCSVTNMNCMFEYCEKLSTLDLSSFCTPNVMDTGGMFYDCLSLTALDVSNFETQKVTFMAGMFQNCELLESLDLTKFDVRNVESMDYMFKNCKSLKELDLSNFQTTSLLTMREMFYDCESLEKLDLSNFDVRMIRDFEGTFTNCESLKELDFSSFMGKKKLYISLYGCNSLEKLTAGKVDINFKLGRSSGKWFDDEKNIYDLSDWVTLAPGTIIYKVKDSYNIRYVYKGKLKDCPATYMVADGLDKLGTVELDYHTFVGWYEDENYTKPVTSIPKGNLGDVTLYAKMDPNTYTITYMNLEKADDTKDMLSEYTYGLVYDLPSLKSTLYRFDGWYLDSEFTTKIESITPTTNGNLVLYAKWTEWISIFALPESVIKITDETILSLPNDKDVKGSSFSMIQARADKTTKNSIRLKWNKVKNADGYKIYANKCGKKNKYEYIKTIANGSTTKFTHKKLKNGTYYKYIVRAYKLVEGQEITLAASKTIHATTTGGKYGNAKSVKLKTDKKMKSEKGSYTLTIKKNKKYTIKASEVKESKKTQKHRKIAYESSDKTIATVSKKGVVKGIKRGTCYIYAYAQNGVYKKIKVKVR